MTHNPSAGSTFTYLDITKQQVSMVQRILSQNLLPALPLLHTDEEVIVFQMLK